MNTELALDDYLGGQAVTHVVHASDRRFDVMLAAALHVADDVQRTKLRRVFPELVDSFTARLSAPAGLMPGEHIPGVGFLGDDGRVKLPCGCDLDHVRELGTHQDVCRVQPATTEVGTTDVGRTDK